MEEVKEVTVHGTWSSPYSMRVEMALKLKGIPYEFVEEDLSNKSQALLKHNPVYKKIPVLVHDGRPIAESLVILEYIEEKWKEPALLPLDSYKRAKVRFWANFYQQKLQEPSRIIIRKEGEERERAMKELFENLNVLEEGLEKDFSVASPFFHGDTPGLLDVILGVHFCFYKVMEEVIGTQLIKPQRNPLLRSWLVALKDHPVVKETFPPHDKLVARIRAYTKSRTIA